MADPRLLSPERLDEWHRSLQGKPRCHRMPAELLDHIGAQDAALDALRSENLALYSALALAEERLAAVPK